MNSFQLILGHDLIPQGGVPLSSEVSLWILFDSDWNWIDHPEVECLRMIRTENADKLWFFPSAFLDSVADSVCHSLHLVRPGFVQPQQGFCLLLSVGRTVQNQFVHGYQNVFGLHSLTVLCSFEWIPGIRSLSLCSFEWTPGTDSLFGIWEE